MNSRKALQAALVMGLNGVEMDVQLSADGVLAAYHEEDLKTLTRCEGKVNSLRWEQLASCAVDDDGASYPIVRLDTALTDLAQRFPQADFTLDCKLFAAGEWWPYMEEFSNAIVRLHQQLRSKLIIECQVTEFLDLLARKDPKLPLYFYATDAEEGIRTALTKGYAGITIADGLIGADEIAKAHEAGLEVTLFGAGPLGEGHAINKMPDRLQTDAPAAYAR